LVLARVKPKFRFVDLFAGIGGFHHAMASLGGRCVLACELDQACQAVYRASFPELPADRLVSDIRAITRVADGGPRPAREIAALVPDHEVLCAGFPCQPFSKSGWQLGVRDRTRGTLFFEIMEIVSAKRPAYLVLENVRNLAGPRHRDTWRTIIESLREAGYRVADEPVVLSPHLIPPDRGGAPQVRDRVFILCERAGDDRRDLVSAPLLARGQFAREWSPDSWRIAKVLEPDRHVRDIERYRLSENELAWEAFVRELPLESLPGFPLWAFAFRRRVEIPRNAPDWERSFLTKNSQLYRDHVAFIDHWLARRWGPRGERVEQFPLSRQKLEWQARKTHPTRDGRTLRDLVLQFRPSGIRVKPATYLPALVAITQTSVVGPEVARGIKEFRRLTPREAAHLQGIPPAAFERAQVTDKDAYRQLGNAVNVGVARLAAQQLMHRRAASMVEAQQELPLLNS
jgi:DNA (cytosine-5)-methyltransferase 1